MSDLYFQGLSTLLTGAVLFGALVATLEVAFRIGSWRRGRREDRADGDGSDVALGSILAILGLVLAFTYGAAVTRSDARKAAVIEEANALGTAFLRSDLAAEPVRSELRSALLAYGRTRIFRLEEVATRDGLEQALARSSAARERLWPLVARLVRDGDRGPLEVAIVQAINEVLDMDTRRYAVAFDRLPPSIVGLLVFLATISMALAGYHSGLSGRLRRWRMAALTAVLATLVAMILDYDRALRGFIVVPQTSLEAVVADMERALD